MTNSTTTNSTRIYDHPIGGTVSLEQARRILTAHGFDSQVEDEGNGAVGLYLLMPWSMADGNGGFRSGEDWEHVQDTETDRIHVSHLWAALGY